MTHAIIVDGIKKKRKRVTWCNDLEITTYNQLHVYSVFWKNNLYFFNESEISSCENFTSYIISSPTRMPQARYIRSAEIFYSHKVPFMLSKDINSEVEANFYITYADLRYRCAF